MRAETSARRHWNDEVAMTANTHPDATPETPAEGSPAAFYNRLAPTYDGMVDIERRVARAGRLVQALRQRFAPMPPRGIDLGCGTGAYTCALAAAGYTAAGLDIAADMLVQARANTRRLGLQATYACGTLEDLPAPFEPGQAGLVLCLGNTLPHLVEPGALQRACRGLAALLDRRGLAVIQVLNYDRILERRERIVSVDRDEHAAFVRFYDFLPDGLVRFNLLRTTWDGREGRPEPLRSVTLRACRRADLEDAARQAGLTTVCCAGDLALNPFDPAASETLLMALRPAVAAAEA